MNTKKRFYLMCLVLGILFSTHPQGWAHAISEIQGPMITSVFAVQQEMGKEYYGPIWKIYVEAEDPDGDMSKIGVRVNQAGYGQLTTDWISLKPQHRNHLKGYLQWDTSSSREWAQITLEIFVIDRAGNASKEARFGLVCVSGYEDNSRPGCLLDQSRPPAPFDNGDILRIGYINVNLANISSQGY